MALVNPLLSKSMSLLGLHSNSIQSQSSEDERQYSKYRMQNEQLYHKQKQLKNHNTIKNCVIQCLSNNSFGLCTQRVTMQTITCQLKDIKQEMLETKAAMKELIYELLQ